MSKTPKQLERLVAGDNKAWGEVIKKYYPQILQWLSFYGGSRGVIEDIAQETFLELYRRIKIDNPKDFRSWVYSIAKRNLYHHLSLSTRERKSVELLNKETPLMKLVENEINDERIRFLEQAILSLSPQQRTVFQLYYIEHMSTKEISKIIGSSENVIRVSLSLGRKMLRRMAENRDLNLKS